MVTPQKIQTALPWIMTYVSFNKICKKIIALILRNQPAVSGGRGPGLWTTWKLLSGGIWNGAHKICLHIHHHILSTFRWNCTLYNFWFRAKRYKRKNQVSKNFITLCRSICYRLMDLVSHPHGRNPREDGAPGHAVPGAGQHLQQCHNQHTQGGGTHSDWGLDVGLYPFCVWSLSRVSHKKKDF